MIDTRPKSPPTMSTHARAQRAGVMDERTKSQRQPQTATKIPLSE
jgi:hypothetical protein